MSQVLVNYFKIDEYNWENGPHYVIQMTDAFYDFFSKMSINRNEVCFSFQHIFLRLFGMMPYDYFNFISAEYNAVLIPKNNAYIHYFFKTWKDADNFMHDANARMRYLVDCNKEKGDQ